MGQALSAGSKTVAPGLSVHSLHAYFVRAGQPGYPIVYSVNRVRNGHSFATRMISAKQNGKYIFTMQVSTMLMDMHTSQALSSALCRRLRSTNRSWPPSSINSICQMCHSPRLSQPARRGIRRCCKENWLPSCGEPSSCTDSLVYVALLARREPPPPTCLAAT